MSKRKDKDYDPLEVEIIKKPKRKKTISRIQRKETLLDDHGKEIINMHQNGLTPTTIAQTLCSKKGLKSGGITGKQISSWIDYRKKSGQIKTRPVSLINNNLRANTEDNCMYYV